MGKVGYFIARSIIHKIVTFILIIILIWFLLDLSISATGTTPYDYLLAEAQTRPRLYDEYLHRINTLGLYEEQIIDIKGNYTLYIITGYENWSAKLYELAHLHNIPRKDVDILIYNVNKTIGLGRIPIVAREYIVWGKMKQEKITIVSTEPRSSNAYIRILHDGDTVSRINTKSYPLGTVIIIDSDSSLEPSRRIGFLKPWYTRLANVFISIIRFDFGESALYHQPVTQVIMTYLPFTIGLVGLAFLMGSMIGFILGFYLSRKRGTWIDTLFTATILGVRAIPVFWLGMVAVYFLAYIYGWFPSGLTTGFDKPVDLAAYITAWFWQTIIPALVLSKIYIVQYLLSIRGLVMDEWNQDYVITFRGAGFSDDYIAEKFIAKTIAPPIITLMAIDLGFVFGGAVVTETVFSYPGIGSLTYNAIRSRDAPLIIGIFTIVTIVVLISITLAEILYSLLDPRIRK